MNEACCHVDACSSTPPACLHGGYPNSRDCTSCICPPGWTGDQCQSLATSMNGIQCGLASCACISLHFMLVQLLLIMIMLSNDGLWTVESCGAGMLTANASLQSISVPQPGALMYTAPSQCYWLIHVMFCIEIIAIGIEATVKNIIRT